MWGRLCISTFCDSLRICNVAGAGSYAEMRDEACGYVHGQRAQGE